LLVRQSTLESEVSVPVFRQPGRHKATLCHQGDLPNALADIRVIEQGEWHHLARSMTWAAVLEDNRSNILGKGRCRDPGRASVVMRTRDLTSRERQHSEGDFRRKKRSHSYDLTESSVAAFGRSRFVVRISHAPSGARCSRTSSMKLLTRKMPRPVPFRRFSRPSRRRW